MKLVQTLVVRDEADIVEAQIAFHLNAGVDFVLAVDHGSSENTAELLASHARDGHLHVIRESGQATDGEVRAHMAELAVTEHGADWVVDTGPREFWWPRGESLTEILAAIPKRYTAVQGLIRPFVQLPDDGALFSERMTVRRSVEAGVEGSRPEDNLESVQRAGAVGSVPLRSWYPIEIFRFPSQAAEPIAEEERARRLDDGSLVVDTRLRDALRAWREGAESLEFPTPDVVDDAAYAVECAAVGEVDLERLERRLDELEAELTRLQNRFWTRVGGRVSRLARSSRRPGS